MWEENNVNEVTEDFVREKSRERERERGFEHAYKKVINNYGV